MTWLRRFLLVSLVPAFLGGIFSAYIWAEFDGLVAVVVTLLAFVIPVVVAAGSYVFLRRWSR